LKSFLILLSFLLSLSSYGAVFQKIRDYRYSYFETEKKCQEFQENTGQWFNCYQLVRFKPNGTADIILSDIANRANYDVDFKMGSIVLFALGPGDMAPKIKFKISPNKRAIVEPNNFKVWELYQVKNSEEATLTEP